MMEAGGILARGALIGFAIAAPVGPIGLLCIRRTFAEGAARGLASGFGAATADAMYGLLAALGLGALTSVLLEHGAALRIGGGLLMAALAVAALRRAVRPPVRTAAAASTAAGLGGAFASTFALTAASPMTILSFVGVLAAFTTPGGGAAGGLWLVAGIFAGSVAWWMLLVGAVSASRRVLPGAAIRWIEGISGAALMGCAIWSVYSGWTL